MYFTASEDVANEVGYAMSRLELDSDICDAGKNIHRDDNTERPNKELNHLDHEISHLTKLRSGPLKCLSQIIPGKRDSPVSTVKVLACQGRNYPGMRRVSRKPFRIYNVDRAWKVQKNILAKSLRWTVTDTSLSPNPHHHLSDQSISLQLHSDANPSCLLT
ncbi:hypothetical protein VitviT2T_007111 [Vitis vinifera]|uniref:Uncharacterized protein n=1 Tax=Vitis vinifera TaxID=29760 RepID=A0ABY9BYG4_VITVI|nr:hypothetical protein VitviT2T_007111 [Vitis vinifera]